MTATKTIARKSTAAATAATEEATAPYYNVSDLVAEFQTSATAGIEAQSVFEQARTTLRNVSAIKARTVYLIATHEDVLTPKTRKAGVNLSGAATLLGQNRTTLITYLTAGTALDKAGLIHESIPTDAVTSVVEKSLDATTRMEAKLKRDKARQKLEAGKVALELQGKTAEGEDVPEPKAAAEPTGAERMTRSAVEDKGTLSVTEEPKVVTAPTTPSAPVAAPVEVEPTAAWVVSAVDTAMFDLRRFLKGGGELSEDDKAQLANLAADLSAITL